MVFKLAFLLPFLVSLGISVGVGWACYRRSGSVSKRYALLALSQASWTFGYVLEMAWPTLAGKIFWDDFQFIGMAGWQFFFLVFAFDFKDRKASRGIWIAASLVPVSMVLMAYFDESFHLVRIDPKLMTGVPFSMLIYGFTPIDWFFAGYFYLCFLIGTLVLLRGIRLASSLHRKQTLLIVAGNLVPVFGTFATLVVKDFPYRDMSPLTFAVGNLIVFWGLRKAKLFDLFPLARDWIIERLDWGVVVLDGANRVVDMNPAARLYCALPFPEATGMDFHAAFPLFADTGMEGGKSPSTDSVAGTVTWNNSRIEVAKQELGDGRNRVRGSVVMLRDVTERARLDTDLAIYRRRLEEIVRERTSELTSVYGDLERKKSDSEALEQRLRQSQRLETVGRLAGGIAHDFNNLLSPILGYAELASMDALGNQNADTYLREIAKAGEMAANLVKQILAFSRPDAPGYGPVDLNSVVRGCASMLRRFIPVTVEFQLQMAASLPRIYGDRTQIEQVFMNLAVNARDAMPQGGKLKVKTYLETRPETRPETRVEAAAESSASFCVLEVEDSGHGMDATTRDRMFDAFYTTKAAGKGTGLGLSTVQSIVQQHHGLIEVESEPGKGTRFKILWPQAPESGIDPHAKTSAEKTGLLMGGETVLVVEDNDFVRKFILLALTVHGYTALEASAFSQVESILKSRRPDLMLIDLELPELGGVELHKKVSTPSNPIPAIFLTGSAVSNPEKFPEGALVLRKPFSIKELLGSIREVLDRIAVHRVS